MLMHIPQVSMTETLFGGLLLAVAFFFIARKLGVANFWAGVLSGLIPFLAYLVYCSQHWDGGDVLAIHFALFLANAGVLTVFGGMQQKKEGMHWAPKIIIGFFIFLVILNAVLLSIASRGLPDQIVRLVLPSPDTQKVHTAFPGTVPHDKNKSYQQHLERIEEQRKLDWKVELIGLDDLENNVPGTIRLRIQTSGGVPVEGAEVRLGLWRLANSRDDREFFLVEVTPGNYEHEIILPDAGRWLAELNIYRASDHFRRQQQFYID
jgi:hypothetical protein